MLFNLLADRAVAIGIFCVGRAEYLRKKRDRWVHLGQFWSDVARWLRLRCVKSFADIRAERENAKP